MIIDVDNFEQLAQERAANFTKKPYVETTIGNV